MSSKREYGIFVWQAENRYRREQALRIYKVRGPAERQADKMNDQPDVPGRGYVVREIY